MKNLKPTNLSGWISLTVFCVALTGCGGSSNKSITTTGPASSTPAITVNPARDWLLQKAQTFASTDPAVEDYSDLKNFGDAIGNARVVALSEQSHGSGTTFDMKTRLVKYLHEQKGFDVLMMESGMFDTNRVWQLAQQGQKIDDLAPDVIFYMYSKSLEGRKVLQYVDSQRTTTNPLIFTGMDSQHTGYRSRDDLLPMLEIFLTSRHSIIPVSANWATYKELVLLAVAMTQARPQQTKLDAFYSVSSNLESELCITQADTFVFPASPGYWCRIVKSLHDQVDRYWNIAGFDITGNRDIAMGYNAQWLIDNQFAGHKIIIWAHSVHTARYDLGDASTDLWHTSMGGVLDRSLSKNMYIVNFTSSSGTTLDDSDLTSYSIAADKPGSVEDVLQRTGNPNWFVDVRGNNPPVSFATMSLKDFYYDYNADIYGVKLGTWYDGLFYIEKTKAATMNR